MDNYRPSWAEIDLNAIAHNVHQVKSLLRPSTRFMCVVKADGYGHGGVKVAEAALAAGVDCLGVATLNEAILLREAGVTAPILLLGYAWPPYYGEALHYHVELTIFRYEDAEALARLARQNRESVEIHVKINTGMNRLGITPDAEGAEIVRRISALPGLKIKGIFTHFAASDQRDQSVTDQQYAAFQTMLNLLRRRGVPVSIRHCANSAATVALPHTHLDMVRAGIICYGLRPSAEVDTAPLRLQPAMSLKTRIVQLRDISPGEAVSYGCTYRSTAPRRIATVPIGYADGYSRLLSNRAQAWLHGWRIPLIGRVCMDQCMFDVTEAPRAQLMDEILLFGPQGVTADDVGDWMGTINYEVVCQVSSRVPRVYLL
jgi:alanine racemase